jgi:hypothetical protein
VVPRRQRDTHADGDTYADPNRDSDINEDADTHRHGDINADVDPNRDGDGNTNQHADADSDAHRYPDATCPGAAVPAKSRQLHDVLRSRRRGKESGGATDGKK